MTPPVPPGAPGLILRRASPAPGVVGDLVVEGGRLVDAPAAGEHEEVDVDGRPVLPGLVDHHIHLLATAAARDSVDCSPAALAAGGGLAAVLRAGHRGRPDDGWLRGVAYDVATSGEIGRRHLDGAAVGPVRIQDRTGIRWVLDSEALARVLPADERAWPDGVERDAAGRPTGVLTRLDAWLGARVPRRSPDLASLGAWLAARGVTAVTDAGAANGPGELATLAAAGMPQRLVAMTGEPEVAAPRGVTLGAVKILLDDADLPGLDHLTERVRAAHEAGRAVAVHSVSAASLVLALAAGVGRNDRIEHASLVPDDVLPLLVEADPTVVVQPALVCDRGDRYLAEVPPDEHGGLHRLGSFRAAGLRVLAGSDAPYGPADPWLGIAAAVARRTRGGRPLGPTEAVDPATALALYAGGDARAGDLAVLDATWDDLASCPDVHAVVIAGRYRATTSTTPATTTVTEPSSPPAHPG